MRTPSAALAQDPVGKAEPLRVFISYSRRDGVAADALTTALEERGFIVIIDKRDLPYGEKWQAELADFIRGADVVLWLVSDESVRSRWCRWEIGEVGRLHKRLVPVRLTAVAAEDLPGEIGRIHLLPADGTFALDQHLGTLVATLSQDRARVKEGTRLGDRARQWLLKGRDRALLLRGLALTDAERWVQKGPASSPTPSPEILELVLASRGAASRRLRWTLIGALGVAAGAIALTVAAVLQRNDALRNQSLFLSNVSRQRTSSGDAGTGALLAMEGLPRWPSNLDRPLVPEALRSLYTAFFALREEALLSGFAADANTVAFSRDGTTLLIPSDDGTVRVWLPGSGNPPIVLRGGAKVRAAVFSPSNREVLVGAEGGDIEVWGTENATLLATLRGHVEEITSLAVDERRGRLVSGSYDTTARLWSLDRYDAITALERHRDWVTSVTVSPDGSRILTTSADGTANVWNAEDGSHLVSLVGHQDRLLGAAWAPDSSRVVTFSVDQSARIWRVAGGEMLRELRHAGEVRAATWDPAGTRVFTGADDGTLRTWAAETGALVRVDTGHDGTVTRIQVSGDGRLLATASQDGRVIVRRTADGERLLTLAGHEGRVLDLAFSPDQRRIATASGDRTVRVWRIDSPLTSRALAVDTKEVRTIDRSPDGKILAVAGVGKGAEGEIEIVAPEREDRRWLRGHRAAVNDVAFDGTGQRLVSASDDGTAIVWDIATARSLPLVGRLGRVASATFCDDGRLVVTGSFDGGAVRWDAATGTELGPLPLPAGVPVVRVRCAPAGDALVTASLDGTARTWVARDGTERQSLSGHRGAVQAVAFDASGRLVVTGSEDKTARLWRVGSNGPPRELLGHTAPVVAVDVSHDGRFVATGSLDQTVRIWDAETAELVGIYANHADPVQGLRFFPHDLQIGSVSTAGPLLLWRVFDSAAEAVRQSRGVVPRTMTGEQLSLVLRGGSTDEADVRP